MNVVQNYLTTFMKGDLGVIEIRIFMKIVEQANHLVQGQRISNLIGKAYCVDDRNCNFIVPLEDIAPGSHHSGEIKRALEKLHDHDVNFYDGDHKTWHLCSLVDNITLKDGDSALYFTVSKWLMNYILNFVNGNFTMYDLQNAMKLTSAYAIRMYWLVCNMTGPMKISIAMLRDMLGVTNDKYKTTKDFIKRCVESSRNLLDKAEINSFTYIKLKGDHGKAIEYIKIFPVKRQVKGKSELTAMATLSAWCNPLLRQYLTTQAGFETRELQSIKPTLAEFTHVHGWQRKIVDIVERARRGRKNKGYIVAAMKSEINENKQ